MHDLSGHTSRWLFWRYSVSRQYCSRNLLMQNTLDLLQGTFNCMRKHAHCVSELSMQVHSPCCHASCDRYWHISPTKLPGCR